MTADVYAADDGLSDSTTPDRSTGCFVIRLISDADPDVLLRVSAQLNVLNEAPKRLVFERRADDIAEMTIVVRCSERAADLVCRKLEQLTSIREVSATADVAQDGPAFYGSYMEDQT
jgi:hypothetical protein